MCDKSPLCHIWGCVWVKLSVFLLYGYKPDQCKQMSGSISTGRTNKVTQRHSYRKRLVAFKLILVGLRNIVMREGLKRWRVTQRKREVGIEGERNAIHEKEVNS